MDDAGLWKRRRARPLGALGRLALGAVLAVGAASCVSPGPGRSATPDGRRLYLTCSGSCHTPEPINDYSRAQWEEIIPDMSREARLSPEKEALLRAYVFAQIGP